MSTGRYAKGAATIRRVLETRERRFGANNAGTLLARNSLGNALMDAGDYDDAAAVLMETARGYRALGPSAATAASIVEGNAANALLYAGRIDEVTPLLTRLRHEILANPNRTSDQLYLNDFYWARVRAARGEYAIAEPELRQVLEAVRVDPVGLHSPRAATVYLSLGDVLLASGRPAQAESSLAVARELFVTRKGADHPLALRSRILLAGAWSAMGRKVEADTIFARAQATLARRYAASHVLRREADVIARRFGFGRAAGPARTRS